MQDELQSSTKEEQEKLLKAAGLAPGEIEAGAGLAMKAELGIPWSKLRHLRRYIPPLSLLRTHAYRCTLQNMHACSIPKRWLKKWGVTMSSEKQQREMAQQWSPDSIEAEYVPFSFPLSNGGEEMRTVPFVYIPDLWTRFIQLLDDMDR